LDALTWTDAALGLGLLLLVAWSIGARLRLLDSRQRVLERWKHLSEVQDERYRLWQTLLAIDPGLSDLARPELPIPCPRRTAQARAWIEAEVALQRGLRPWLHRRLSERVLAGPDSPPGLEDRLIADLALFQDQMVFEIRSYNDAVRSHHAACAAWPARLLVWVLRLPLQAALPVEDLAPSVEAITFEA